MDPFEIDPRYRKTAKLGMWIGGTIAIICTPLALLSRGGFFGDTEDPVGLAIFAAAGVLLLVVSRFVIGRSRG